MKLRRCHAFDVTIPQAREIQDRLRAKVIAADRLGRVRFIAGVDVGMKRGSGEARAAVAVLRLPGLDLVERVAVTTRITFPYVPGYLSFREIPAIESAFARLRSTPDLILCDGQGYAHPRRFGLACHLGVLADIPTIGVAKTRLLGEHGPVPAGRGGWCALWHEGEVVGAVLRSREGVKPLYVSVGHRIGLASAVRYVMAATTRYRLPETTRLAHQSASREEG
jgi:deoxyribonuclease V